MIFLHPGYVDLYPLCVISSTCLKFLAFFSLPTVCRKCIHKKLSDEEMECCPVCNIDLGCVPLEKLRLESVISYFQSVILIYVFILDRHKFTVDETLADYYRFL